jgi:hypothetical protein
MAQQTLSTTNHDTIRKWADARKATPSVVTEEGDKTGILRLDFPDYTGEDLQEVNWDEWFQLFDQNELQLIYQEETKDGEQSNFNKLVSRED